MAATVILHEGSKIYLSTPKLEMTHEWFMKLKRQYETDLGW